MAKVLHLSRNTAAKHMRLLEEHGLIIAEMDADTDEKRY